jgi:hypothetical protein
LGYNIQDGMDKQDAFFFRRDKRNPASQVLSAQNLFIAIFDREYQILVPEGKDTYQVITPVLVIKDTGILDLVIGQSFCDKVFYFTLKEVHPVIDHQLVLGAGGKEEE